MTGPAVPAGETTVSDVADFELTVAASAPNWTLVVEAKLVPEIVTVVPPLAGPLDGVTEPIVGAPETNEEKFIAVPEYVSGEKS